MCCACFVLPAVVCDRLVHVHWSLCVPRSWAHPSKVVLAFRSALLAVFSFRVCWWPSCNHGCCCVLVRCTFLCVVAIAGHLGAACWQLPLLVVLCVLHMVLCACVCVLGVESTLSLCLSYAPRRWQAGCTSCPCGRLRRCLVDRMGCCCCCSQQ